MDFRLKPLFRERGFWASLLVSAPGIAALYAEAMRSIINGWPMEADVTTALAASPLVLYLSARQVPRARAIDAQAHTMMGGDAE